MCGLCPYRLFSLDCILDDWIYNSSLDDLGAEWMGSGWVGVVGFRTSECLVV